MNNSNLVKLIGLGVLIIWVILGGFIMNKYGTREYQPLYGVPELVKTNKKLELENAELKKRLEKV